MSAISRAVTGGVQSLASWAFGHMTSALVATTQVQLGGWFDGPWRAMIAVAGVFALPFLLVGVATEAIAGRPVQALRRGVLMPLAVAPGLLAARGVLALVLALVDSACELVVQVGIGGSGGFARALTRMGLRLGVSASPLAPQSGAAIGPLIVVFIAAVLAFVIWIELACRAALVLLLVAFVPLAFAGLFWHGTARWARRLVEVLAAVVLAQLVITVLMVLAAAALADPGRGWQSGVDGVAVGLALLFLGSLGLPMTFRVVPHVMEAAVVAGSGAAVANRVRRAAGHVVAGAPSPVTRLAGSAGSGALGRPPGMPAPGPSASNGAPAQRLPQPSRRATQPPESARAASLVDGGSR